MRLTVRKHGVEVLKEYASQAQRNYMEMLRHRGGKGPIPKDVLNEFHDKSKGHMGNKDLPERSKRKKGFREVFDGGFRT